MKRTSLMLAAATAALLSGSALAQEFSEWDENADATVSQEEFNIGFDNDGTFHDWNTVADDEGLTEDEFGEGLFGAWDENDDAMLDETEFSEGYGAFGEEGDETSTALWENAGEDEMLDEEEFTTGFSNSGLYEQWDADTSGFVDEEEFTGGAFETADADDSGAIKEEEWEDDGWF